MPKADTELVVIEKTQALLVWTLEADKQRTDESFNR